MKRIVLLALKIAVAIVLLYVALNILVFSQVG